MTLHRGLLALAVAAVLGLASTASAEDTRPLVLSLGEAIARAEAHAPEVVLATHAVRETAARREGAGVVLPTNPRLSMDLRPGITGVTGSTDPNLGYSSILDFMFEVGGAPSARVREVQRFTDVAQGELGLERVRARIAAWTAYLRARVAEERVAQTVGQLEIAERILDASRQRAEAGASGDIEQSLARTEVAELQAAIDDARRQREAQVSALRDAIDLGADVPLTLTTPLEEPKDVPPRAALVERALAARPEFDVIRKRIALLDATEERLSRETFPRIGAYLGVDAAPQSPIFGVVGTSIELPFAQRNQGPRAVARAGRAREMERLELEARRVVREVVAARSAYESRRAQLKELTERALPAAERTMQLVEAGWRSGRFDLFRVTSAARDVSRVRGLRLDAFEATWLERIALDRATGGL